MAPTTFNDGKSDKGKSIMKEEAGAETKPDRKIRNFKPQKSDKASASEEKPASSLSTKDPEASALITKEHAAQKKKESAKTERSKPTNQSNRGLTP